MKHGPTWKEIEASRNARLWITTVVIPVAGIIVAIPEARQALVDDYRFIKEKVRQKTYEIKNKFKTKGS